MYFTRPLNPNNLSKFHIHRASSDLGGLKAHQVQLEDQSLAVSSMQHLLIKFLV
jgi:hypothetical protein